MTDRPRRIVRDGYDRLGVGYSEWAARVEKDPRDEMLSTFAGLLPSGARVLDLGCGSGLPSTAAMATQYKVTGVDISEAQVRAARRNVPGTTFIHGDALQVSFAEGSFEGVVALYAISHIPRAEHAQLFQRVYRWLVPGGLFLATLGATDAPDWTGDWLGLPMLFSAHDATTNRSLLREAGFDLLVNEIRQTDEPEGAVSFLWVIARRPL